MQICKTCGVLADIEEHRQDVFKAVKYLEKGVTLCESIKEEFDQYECCSFLLKAYQHLARLNDSIGQVNKAHDYYNKTLDLSEKLIDSDQSEEVYSAIFKANIWLGKNSISGKENPEKPLEYFVNAHNSAADSAALHSTDAAYSNLAYAKYALGLAGESNMMEMAYKIYSVLSEGNPDEKYYQEMIDNIKPYLTPDNK